MDKPQAHKLKLPLLILVLVLVLGGGGFAIWMVTKKEEEQTAIQPQEGATLPPVGGRIDASSLYSDEELKHSALVNEDLPNRTPEYEAVLIDSKEGKKLIEDRMRTIQLNKKDSDFIRAKHLVGRTLVGNKVFNTKANKAIDKMFGLVEGTTAGNYKTYPVYGRFETEAAPLRADIENFLSKDGQGYNLTSRRHGGNAWWFGSVGLNLMYGSNDAHVHSADKLWWYKGGQEGRDGLDFFKLVNGHNVDDKKLVDKKRNGKGVFAAWNMYNFVKEWRSAMDFFDKVTKEEAITALEREGLIKRL
jgi:hypothetical protein